MTPQERLTDSFDGLEGPLGLAVSGGSDSLALLFLTADWAASRGVELFVATVNHGLRAEAEDECVAVARHCASLGVEHQVLDWAWDGAGNLQAAARSGRYDALAGWAHERGLRAVAIGHTQDDVAETFLMRLARGSGVTGLAQMAKAWRERDVNWLRPLLACSRDELRDYLTARGLAWSDDSSNNDMRYGRVKTRDALNTLEGLGVTREDIAQTAARLADARDALDVLLSQIARQVVTLDGPDLLLDFEALSRAPDETRQRLFGLCLSWVGQTEYPPRRQAVVSALEAAQAGRKATLNGCVVTQKAGQIRMTRELAAVQNLSCKTDMVWDGRFELVGLHATHLHVAALGESGLAQCVDWREAGLPRPTLLASPAVWERETLVAAPFAGLRNGWTAKFVSDPPFLMG